MSIFRLAFLLQKTIHASNAWLSTGGITPCSSQTRTTCNVVCHLRGDCISFYDFGLIINSFFQYSFVFVFC